MIQGRFFSGKRSQLGSLSLDCVVKTLVISLCVAGMIEAGLSAGDYLAVAGLSLKSFSEEELDELASCLESGGGSCGYGGIRIEALNNIRAEKSPNYGPLRSPETTPSPDPRAITPVPDQDCTRGEECFGTYETPNLTTIVVVGAVVSEDVEL